MCTHIHSRQNCLDKKYLRYLLKKKKKKLYNLSALLFFFCFFVFFKNKMRVWKLIKELLDTKHVSIPWKFLIYFLAIHRVVQVIQFKISLLLTSLEYIKHEIILNMSNEQNICLNQVYHHTNIAHKLILFVNKKNVSRNLIKWIYIFTEQNWVLKKSLSNVYYVKQSKI